MYWVSLVIFILCFVGITAVLGIRLSDIVKLLTQPKKSTLKEEIGILTGKIKRGYFSQEQYEVQQLLDSTGRAAKFEALKKSCVLLFAVGVLVALLLNNLFLVPVLGIGFAIAPYWYIRSVSCRYKKQLNVQMESALSIITSSYLRTDDIVTAIEENLAYITEPLKTQFEAFVAEVKMFNPSIITALSHLRSKIPNAVFSEWCDTLMLCQTDRNLKYLLINVTQKYSDIRLVQSALDGILSAPKRETFLMMGLVVANIPLLYVLNKEWFHILMFTIQGKFALAICGAILLVSLIQVMRLSKPIEYRSEEGNR